MTSNFHNMVPRHAETTARARLAQFPVVAILGPRQCGKSTLARKLSADFDSVYLDLERPADLLPLRDPDAFLELNVDKLICLDEVQRTPNLFPVIRAFVDRHPRPGRLLLLGSASPALLRQTSETLAGRIAV